MKRIKLDTSLGKENLTMESTLIKINDQDKVKKEDVLLQAVKTGDYEKLEKLLSSGISVEAENFRKTFPNSGAPLHIAASSGYAKCVEILINYGANLKGKDKFGCTALHLASQHGHYPCLKMLLEAGADCCIPIDMPFCDRRTPYLNGRTALHLASKFNHVDCVEELIRYGANCDAVDMYGLTSLCIAAKAGNSEIVLTHLRHAHSSSFLSLPTYDTSDTPLHFAVTRGMLECVKELVRLGSDVNHINSRGFSPLHLTCHRNIRMEEDIRLQIVKILVLEGHNIDVSDPSCDILFQDHLFPEVKAFLIAYGANTNIRSSKDNLTLLEHELILYRNLHRIKCIVNCMPHTPHLKSLNVYILSPPFLKETMIHGSLVLHDNVALRLIRGRNDMYIGINYSNAKFVNLMEMRNLFSRNSFSGYPPDQIVPLRQPYINLVYEHVNGKSKEACTLQKYRLLKLKQHLWYELMASTPRSLQNWCRFSIRKCMGPSNLKHINKLPLPKKFFSYLLFEYDE